LPHEVFVTVIKITVMRLLLILLLAAPLFSAAQINRSANEVAQSATKDYIVNKVFRDKVYNPVWFGQLRERVDKKDGTNWIIEHRFEIAEKQPSSFNNQAATKKEYSFMLFFDKRMKIIRAESYTIAE